jgi:hypothetical protein
VTAITHAPSEPGASVARGLTSAEAAARLARDGPDRLRLSTSRRSPDLLDQAPPTPAGLPVALLAVPAVLVAGRLYKAVARLRGRVPRGGADVVMEVS